MNRLFPLKDLFGAFLADGEQANAFRFTEVEPAVAQSEHVVFDLEGVTNMTDSFGNALFATLFQNHPELTKGGMEFRNCSPLLRILISAAVNFGTVAARKQQPA